MNKEIKVNDVTQNLSGNVTVKVKDGKKTIKTFTTHNTATLDLLYEMLLSLSGSFDSNKLPKYIGVGIGTTTDIDTYKLTKLISEITINRTILTPNYKGAPIKNDNGSASVTYQGIIPYTNIGTTQSIKEIGLFGTQTGDSLLTRIQVDPLIDLSVKQGQSLVIEWVFTIKNTQ